MDLVSNGALNLSKTVVHEFSVLRLQEANIVGSVDATITSYFLLEFVLHVLIFLQATEKVTHLIIQLSLDLHVIYFGDQKHMVQSSL